MVTWFAGVDPPPGALDVPGEPQGVHPPGDGQAGQDQQHADVPLWGENRRRMTTGQMMEINSGEYINYIIIACEEYPLLLFKSKKR